jgi:hypothetical protein
MISYRNTEHPGAFNTLMCGQSPTYEQIDSLKAFIRELENQIAGEDLI